MSTEGDANELITEHKNDEAIKTKQCEETEKRKFLIYNPEGEGETTKSFINALKQTLGDFDSEDYATAEEEEEKCSLPIIAVVRHTSTRMEEILKELKDKFDKENIKNLKRIIVTYFYMKGQEEATHKAQTESESIFAKVVVLDFIDNNLGKSGFLDNYLFCRRKRHNETALEELKASIKLGNMKTTWSADVFIESNLPFVNRFFEKLKQEISQSICLKIVQTFEELEHGTSPTLIFMSGDPNGFLKRLEEKNSMKVFLVNIIDIATTSKVHVHASDVTENLMPADAERGNKTAARAQNRPMPCQHYGKIWEVHHCNGKFLEERNFIKSFQKFVFTCPT